MSKRIDLVGRRFGKLVVLRLETISPNWRCSWWVHCDCGVEKAVLGGSLRSGRTRSCGCELRKKMLAFNHDARLRPYEGLYNLFVRAAIIVDKGLSITYDDFFEFTKTPNCHYCSTPIKWIGEYSAKGTRYNLDRKDSHQGYTKENCVVCCTDCNFAKGARYSHNEWAAMAEALRAYREKTL
jgi:hypothetical protein